MLKGEFSVDGTNISDLKKGSNVRVVRICDICGEEREMAYSTYTRNKRRRKIDNLDLCYSCANKKSYEYDKNRAKRCSTLFTGRTHPQRRKGAKFSQGGGGGYLMVRDGDSSSFVMQHRKIVEEHLGRPLTEEEVVHHIDGNKLNNDLSNLYVCKNSQHQTLHSQLEQVAFKLVEAGLIKFFDVPGEGRYYLDPALFFQTLPKSIEFNQVTIEQSPNPVDSRLDVDISSEVIRGVKLQVPIIASNMSTVTNANFCIDLYKLGALGVLHRAAPDSWIVKETKKIAKQCEIVAVSVGINDSQYDLCKQLIRAGANVIFVDVAHGYSKAAIDFAKTIKTKHYRSAKVVLGNTINVGLLHETYKFIDAIKVGIGSGAACTTRETAGCYEGQFSAVSKFKKASKDLGVPVISDGGIRKPEDFVKAIGAGASSVMAGSLFASTNESAAPVVEGKKLYAGMSSEYVQKLWRGGLKPGTCAEGKVIYLEPTGPVSEVINEYAGALRSGLTYTGSTTIREMHDNIRFMEKK